MLASARRRACTAGYHLPAAARLRAICRPGDLARRKPRAAANSPGGRERPPYILRQTNGKTGNGRPPQNPRNEFRFRQNCTEPHTTPAQGRMLASARRRACAAGYRLPVAARLQAICRAGDLARRKPRAAASSPANSPGGRERPPRVLPRSPLFRSAQIKSSLSKNHAALPERRLPCPTTSKKSKKNSISQRPRLPWYMCPK